MNKRFFIPVICALVLSGCSHPDSNNVTPAANNTQQNNIVTTGKWVVSYYYDNDKDETSDYTGYTFEFGSDNTITATKNGQSTTGTWSRKTDDNLPRFVIALNTSDKELSELNDDWVIDAETENQMKLKDDNTTKNEQLHFTKQ